MSFDYAIRAETAQDHAGVRETHARAFDDADRVPGLVDALRAAPAALAPISLVATVDDQVVGHVMLSACRLDAERRLVNVFSLSPMGSWSCGARSRQLLRFGHRSTCCLRFRGRR